MPAPAFHTADMVRALPDDGNRYETVHGELLVTPSPRLTHQRVVRRLLAALTTYLAEHPDLGEVLMSPADLSWPPDTLVQPDLFVAPLEETRTDDWRRVKTLLLAIEVLSPSTARADRFTKRRLYQEVGIPTYWIVDTEQEAVEIWTPAATFPAVERETLTWSPAAVPTPFILSIPDLFRPV